MKLVCLNIVKADTCGGLLDGLFVPFRESSVDTNTFDPMCLIGPNGSGKSQLLQIIAEIFQAAFHKFSPTEELGIPNEAIEFEMEYLLASQIENSAPFHIKLSRIPQTKRRPEIKAYINIYGCWHLIEDIDIVQSLLPSKIIGYTSGANETLSLPFFSSRAGYANKVTKNALDVAKRSESIKDPRLLLVDYSTNLEVLVANLLLSPPPVIKSLLAEPQLESLRSFRCVVQLNHTAAPNNGGVKLTEELEGYVQYLKYCSTCYDFDEKQNAYIFDFLVTPASRSAFSNYWPEGALELYSCFHKLAMLNDLIIPKRARELFDKSVKNRRFASRLPEPFEEHKVFRFERVEFISKKSQSAVEYASLSDGEHQLAQLLGTACMASFPNVLFLLDEPESHFNPQWRVEFISKFLKLPVNSLNDDRSKAVDVAKQECLITTHSPFVPSDMSSDNVVIFERDSTGLAVNIRRPRIETYGSTFDAILEDCFSVNPPMSELPRQEIKDLLNSDSADDIRKAMNRLGDSVDKLYLADRIRKLDSESK